ncbi:hypothetical protein ABPG72_004686 [Tetrahymena utriculariae]
MLKHVYIKHLNQQVINIQVQLYFSISYIKELIFFKIFMKQGTAKHQEEQGYYLQYDRCIKQHHSSPKIFICVDDSCKNKNLLCHYCINDSFHNYNNMNSSQSAPENQKLNHKDHKVIPIEEYISTFHYIYYNQKVKQPTVLNDFFNLTQQAEFSQHQSAKGNYSPSSFQSSDWKDSFQQKYIHYLKCLRNQILDIYQFVEEQIQQAEKVTNHCFYNLQNYEKKLQECYSQFENKNEAVSSEIVQQFVSNSFHFLIDNQSRLKDQVNGGGFVELLEYTQDDQTFQVMTQKDIQTKIIKQFNHIKKISDYFFTLSNEIHKKFRNGLISAPFYESPIVQNNQNDSSILSQEAISTKFLNNSYLTSQHADSSQLATQIGQQNIGSSQQSFSNFANNQSNPENLFSSMTAQQKIFDIHSKSIWRVLHLYKAVCASCSSDGTIKIWDLKTQKIIKIFNSFNDAVNDLVYIPKQKLLISVSGDNKIRVFSLINYKCIRIIEGHLNAIYTCHYDQYKNLLLTAGREEEVYGWNILTGQKVFKAKSIQRSIYSLQSVSCKDSFLCGDEGGSLSVFNYSRPQVCRSQPIHSKTIYSIKVLKLQGRNSRRDIQFVTSSADGFIKISSFETLEILNQIKLNSFIYDISIHMNRIFAQIGKTSNLAIIGLVQQRGNIEITTKLITLSNPNKVRCLQIIKDQNIILYESTQNDINYDINIEQF